jgi:hypothetical protein
MTQDETGQFWPQPGGSYWQAAVDELGGDATLSQVYERAWQLQNEDEGLDDDEEAECEPGQSSTLEEALAIMYEGNVPLRQQPAD